MQIPLLAGGDYGEGGANGPPSKPLNPDFSKLLF